MCFLSRSPFHFLSAGFAMPVSHEDVRQLTKAEWEERLTPEQFSVCREQCTEPVGVQSEQAVFYMSGILT